MWRIDPEELHAVAEQINGIANRVAVGQQVVRNQRSAALTIPRGFQVDETKKVIEAYLPFAIMEGPYTSYGDENNTFLSQPHFRHIVNRLTPAGAYSQTDRYARRDQVWVLLYCLYEAARQPNSPLMKWWDPRSFNDNQAVTPTPLGDRDSERIAEDITPSPVSAETGIPSWLKWVGAAGAAWWLLA